MNVLTIIDSLNPGGAEKMAINIANSLSKNNINSYLCVTRISGPLHRYINSSVHIYFLRKKATYDIKAFYRLRHYVLNNQIQIIHSHNYSVFSAVVVKYFPWTIRDVKIIWHYHSSVNPFNGWYVTLFKWVISHLVDKIFVVDLKSKQQLIQFCKKHDKVDFIENFVWLSNRSYGLSKNICGLQSKRVINVANISPIKDQITLVKAFKLVIQIHPDASLYIVGNVKDTKYYNLLLKTICELQISQHVKLMHGEDDIGGLLSQMSVGVISSKTEGTPLALLEYGLAKLAVVSTNVGNCGKIIENNISGLLVQAENETELASAIISFLESESLKKKAGIALYEKIHSEYSEKVAMDKIINHYYAVL